MVWTTVIALTVAGLLGVFLAPSLAGRPGLRDRCTAFAGGVLLTMIIAHVIPESVLRDHRYGGAVMLLGFIAMMFLQQKVIKADPCCGHEHAKHAGLPSYLALMACSINDGIILHPVKSPTDPLLWGMCIHKMTAAFALVMLLRQTSAGLKASIHLVYMMIFVLITPVVVLASKQLVFLQDHMHYVVALAAGALLYVVGGGMIPLVEHKAKEGRSGVLLAFLLAVAITILVELVAPHHHYSHH